MPLALLALAVASFGIGSTEFVIMGLLPDVARDLGIGIPKAGTLVSGYALAVVIGGPAIVLATLRLPRKTTLLLLGCVFIAGNLLCAIAPSYTLLLLARVVTAFAHGSFFGIGAVVATELVPREQRARAVAMLFAGLTLANVLGVPLGTLLGQAAGWRAAFWAVTGIGVLALAALAAWVPDTRGAAPVRIGQELRALLSPQVVLAMLLSVVSSISLFSLFTYIAPYLNVAAGISPHGVTGVLLLLGVGLTVGNLLGGRIADWRLMPGVIATFAGLALVLLGLTVASGHPVTVVANLTLWAMVAFMLASPLQTRIVDQAQGAPNLASTLNQSAFNLGNAGGAWVGGLAVAGPGYGALPWLAASAAGVGLALAALSFGLDRRGMRRAADLPVRAAL